MANEPRTRLPDAEGLIIVSGDEVRYETLVHAMDVTRSASNDEGLRWLFPAVSPASIVP